MYYYACSYPLKEGSIICKGNWGRINGIDYILRPRELIQKIRLENIFEQVRIEKYNYRPSRNNCNFLCPHKEILLKFLEDNSRWFDLLYEVEIMNDDRILITNWSLANSVTSDISNEEIRIRAIKYWKPELINETDIEILVDSDIKIIKQLEDIPDVRKGINPFNSIYHL